MFSKQDLTNISQCNTLANTHAEKAKITIAHAKTHVNKIRRIVTGEHIVDQFVPKGKAKYDFTHVQKQELLSGRSNTFYRWCSQFKVDDKVATKMDNMLSHLSDDPKLKADAKVAIASKVLLNAPKFYKAHKSLLKYAYHFPHLCHLRSINHQLLSDNPYLRKLLLKQYPGGNVEDVAKRNQTSNALISHKDKEIASWQSPKFGSNNYPININDDPYLRLVLYTSQHTKAIKHHGNRFSIHNYKHNKRTSLAFLHNMQYASYRVIRNQMQYNYIPLNQLAFDRQNHKALLTDTSQNSQDNQKYSLIDNHRQQEEKNLINRNMLRHLDSSTKALAPVKFHHGMWASYRKLTTTTKPMKQSNILPNFDTRKSRKKISKLINNYRNNQFSR